MDKSIKLPPVKNRPLCKKCGKPMARTFYSRKLIGVDDDGYPHYQDYDVFQCCGAAIEIEREDE